MAATLKIVARMPTLHWERDRPDGFMYWWFRGTVRNGRLTSTYKCNVIAAQIGRHTENGSGILSVVRSANSHEGGDAARAADESWNGEWCGIPEANDLGGYAIRKITHADFGYWWFRGHVQMEPHTIADYSEGIVVQVAPGAPHVYAAEFARTITYWAGVWCAIPVPI